MILTPTTAFILDCFATMLINSSLSVQKLAHRDVEKLGDNGNERAYCSNPKWWMGFVMIVCGISIHIIVLPYADISLLAANAPLAIIVNIFLSIYLFDEKFVFKYDCPAIFLICLGCVMAVLLAHKTQVETNTKALLGILTSPKAVCFFVFVVLFMLITIYAVKRFEKALKNFEDDAEQFDKRISLEHT